MTSFIATRILKAWAQLDKELIMIIETMSVNFEKPW